MLLVSGFRRWHWAVGLVLALVLNPLAVASDCFESTGNEVTLSGSCTKANTTLFVKGTEQSLDFVLKPGSSEVSFKRIKLAIGECDFSGLVSYGGGSNSIRFSDPNVPSPEFPVNFKADSNGIEFTRNPNKYKAATCSPKFEQVEGGYKVSIMYDSNNVILPDFKITFENAHLYVPPIAGADWSYKGWRLWTVVGSVVAGVVIVAAIIVSLVFKIKKNKKRQLEEGGQTENKSTAKSSLKSKSILKKNKSKSAEKTAAKVVGKDDWMKTFAWPLEYTSEVIDMMIVRFDVPNSPAYPLLVMRPMTEPQEDAFNRWSIQHERACVLRNEMALTPALYNRLMAECRVISNIVDAGKRLGYAHSVPIA
ncbi:hypothetical protein M3Y94_00969000 [Aphelenchoides besseyi]|nr:hypothetical protein M3Y94_00969000 [Aphelenchoides besseyi]KAI6224637.1 hypothetical protein M3Y95_00773900 [Aphelenchoides besseyi]